MAGPGRRVGSCLLIQALWVVAAYILQGLPGGGYQEILSGRGVVMSPKSKVQNLTSSSRTGRRAPVVMGQGSRIMRYAGIYGALWKTR